MSQHAQTDFPLQLRSRGLAIGPRLLTSVLNRISDALTAGQLTVELPDGRRVRAAGAGAGPAAAMKIKRDRIARQLLFEGTLGLADSYVAGDWESDDLTAVIELGAKNLDSLAPRFTPLRVARALGRLHQRLKANTRRGSRRNIAAHYDLGNEFYAAWLDPSMTYSAACFEPEDDSLTTSQIRKFDQLAEMLDLKPGDQLLEIGCGWGAFAIHAATHYGCQVTALTVSPSQAAWARRKVSEAGLDARVEIRLQDYRDITGSFDKIASIEMFEAVGEAYWDAYFEKVNSVLKPGGQAGIQVITINEDTFPYYRDNPDFIQRYVFPGGMLPPPSMLENLPAENGLTKSGELIFARDYARTLAQWRDRFGASWGILKTKGFDERFKRMWDFYMYYCEAGFEEEFIDVRQVCYTKTA